MSKHGIYGSLYITLYVSQDLVKHFSAYSLGCTGLTEVFGELRENLFPEGAFCVFLVINAKG